MSEMPKLHGDLEVSVRQLVEAMVSTYRWSEHDAGTDLAPILGYLLSARAPQLATQFRRRAFAVTPGGEQVVELEVILNILAQAVAAEAASSRSNDDGQLN